MGEFPILDGTVEDNLVEEAAQKGVVMFVGALADHMYPLQIAKTLGECNVVISQEERGRARVLVEENGYDLDIIAHLITRSPQSRRNVLFEARSAVNHTVAQYLAYEPFRDNQVPFREEQAEAQINDIINNQ